MFHIEQFEEIMRKKIVFNMKDREQHMELLKQLYGDSDVKEKKCRQEADIKVNRPEDHSKRISGM